MSPENEENKDFPENEQDNPVAENEQNDMEPQDEQLDDAQNAEQNEVEQEGEQENFAPEDQQDSDAGQEMGEGAPEEAMENQEMGEDAPEEAMENQEDDFSEESEADQDYEGGKEIDSIQFSEISSLISELEYDKAKKAIEDIWEDAKYDIRIYIYKLFCDVHDEKLANFDEYLHNLNSLLTDDGAKLQPQINLKIHISNSLSWFFKTLKQAILYINSETPEGYNPERGEQVADELDNLQKILNDDFSLDFQAVTDEMKSLVFDAMERNKVDEPEKEASAEEDEDVSQEGVKIVSTAGAGPASDKWEAFRNKIETFEALMAEERFLEAAVFFQSINNDVINFDPREFFPDVFFPLYKAMTKNFDKVLNIINQNKDTLEWHVTEQMYKISSQSLAADKSLLKGQNEKAFIQLPDFLAAMKNAKPKEGLVSEQFMQPGAPSEGGYDNMGESEMGGGGGDDYYRNDDNLEMNN